MYYVVVLIAALYITDTDYLIKAVRTIYMKGHSTAYLEDYKEFDNRVIEASNNPQPWPKHQNYNSIKETSALSDLNESSGTIAYVIIKNDSIWFENYYDGFTEDSKSNSLFNGKKLCVWFNANGYSARTH